MFNIGDRVIYGSIGICEISGVVKNKLTGTLREYYVLNPVLSNQSVVYVPIDNDKLTNRMFLVPTPKELRKMLSQLKDSKIDWIDNNTDRSKRFYEIFNEGDIREVITLFNTLHTRRLELIKRGKHLAMSDERLYKDCTRLLCTEISIILNIDEDKAFSLLKDEKI